MKWMRFLGVVLVIGVGFASSANGSCLFTEPASRYCHLAREIPGSVGQHVVLMDASSATDTASMSCSSNVVGNVVYFLVRPSVSGQVTVSTCHPMTMYDTVLDVSTGELCEFSNTVVCNDDSYDAYCDYSCSGLASKVTFYAVAGGYYWIRVGSYNQNNAGCELCLGLIVTIGNPCGEPPRNIVCQEAYELPGTFGSHEMTVDATDTPLNTQSWSCASASHPVWFKFTPTLDGTATFTTCHTATAYDTVVTAVNACSGMVFTFGCNDDMAGCGTNNLASEVSFEVNEGYEYFVAVGAYGTGSAGCLGVRLTIVECLVDSDCDDDNPCTEDTCGAGTCEIAPLAAGYPCPDDSNQCTDDICNGLGACTHPYSPAGSVCGDPADTGCTNPDTCNGRGQCLPNHELAGYPCPDDGNQCTNDICNGLGTCTHPNSPAGSACGDPADTGCTNPDTCNGDGQCLPNHEPAGYPCPDDGNQCTNDICNGLGACTHPNSPAGSYCGDPADTDCTDPDTCNGAGTCRSNHAPFETPCPDSLFCNGSEACDGVGSCQPGPEPCLPGEICDEETDQCKPSGIIVPNVVALTQDQAEEIIISAGLVVGTIVRQYSDTVPPDHVISQNPPSNASVAIGTGVDLVVSSGIDVQIRNLRGSQCSDYVGKTVSVEGIFVRDPRPMLVTSLDIVMKNEVMPVDEYIPLTGEIADAIDDNEYGGAKLKITGVVIGAEICRADLDRDGDVDGADLAMLSDVFGSSEGEPSYDPGMDFDGSGTVDSSDLIVFASEFGREDCPVLTEASILQVNADKFDDWVCKSCILVSEFQLIAMVQKYCPSFYEIAIKPVIPQPHRYAILFSGGINNNNAHKRYWMDLKFIYSTLINEYGYDPNNMAVLYKDGKAEDKDMPVQDSATQTNLAEVLGLLKEVSTDLDFVFIFTTNHGGGFKKDDISWPIGKYDGWYRGLLDTDNDEGTEQIFESNYRSCFGGSNQGGSCDSDSYCPNCTMPPGTPCCDINGLDLDGDGNTNDQVSWDEELCAWGGSIYDDEFANMLQGIKYSRMVIVMEQCFSGGFLRDLSGSNRIIMSAATQYESSWCKNLSPTNCSYNEFSYHFTCAVNSAHPNGTSVDADSNNDGHVSMVEAFNYAVSEDQANETPMYDDNGDGVPHSGTIPSGGDGTLGSSTSLGGQIVP